MPDSPAYVILGRGRWAKIIRDILTAEGRRVTILEETRRAASESEMDYRARLSERLHASSSQIAWLAVHPGPHVPPMLEAVLDAGLHSIVEKPWWYSPAQSASLGNLAHSKSLVVGVHFEYCLLDQIESWRESFGGGVGLTFGGSFRLSRTVDAAIPAVDNLGCHLFAIREYAVARAAVGSIACSYGQSDERRVRLEEDGKEIAAIDFFGNRERIIQRYIARFEAAVGSTSRSFAFDLGFAARVAEAVSAWRGPANNRSPDPA
ncbi:MAG TPA: hypothetical protein VMB02_14845 [Candidatus Aquilonibacter sp.]|nr:hypothetical protein [Candidatus Aquilonibacter sp.]